MVRIYINKTHKDSVIPEIAYNGTSAAFDLTCIEDTIIPAKGSAFVEHGLKITIDEREPYYLQFFARSSSGIKKNLRCHPGIIDAGYTGEIKVYLHNLSNEDVKVSKGDRLVQLVLHRKHAFEFIELNDNEFSKLEKTQTRGDKGFGSTGR